LIKVWIPLHRIAHRSNDIALFKYFIDKGVDLHLQDNGGDSPFMNIANSADLAVMEYVYAFAKAKYINHKDETGKTALTMAVNRNTASMVEFLISKNADVNVIDKKGNTLGYYLLNSYRSSNTEDFESKLALLKKSGVNLKATQQDGEGAYVIISLINPDDEYEQTLYVQGTDSEWYSEITEWWQFYGKRRPDIDAISGATVSGGERKVNLIKIPKDKIDAGYSLRFETAVEDQEYYLKDLQFELTTANLKTKKEGAGYIRYVRMMPQ